MLLKSPVILTLDLISSRVVSYFVNFSSVPRLPTLHDLVEGIKGLSIWSYSLLRFITETQQGSTRKKNKQNLEESICRFPMLFPRPPLRGHREFTHPPATEMQ